MEKRVILAFVLSFLVMISWSYLFGPKKEQAPTEDSSPLEKETPLSHSPVTPIPEPVMPSRAEEIAVPLIEDKEIKVETPLYEAIFSTAGAAIRSFKLKNYRETLEEDSPLIELATSEGSGDDLLEAGFKTQSTLETNRIFYDPDKSDLSLGPESSPQDLTFHAMRPDGVSVEQTFRFYPDTYQIDLIITLLNLSGHQVEGNLKASINNVPPEKKRGYYSFMGVALFLDRELEEIKPKKMEEQKNLSGRIEWMAYEDTHFLTAVIPDDPEKGSFTGELLPSGVLKATYTDPTLSLAPQEQASSRLTLYLGPRDLNVLKKVGKNLDQAVDFGWTDIIAKPLLYILLFFNKYVNNYGVAIILLTILVKLLFWPLTHKSQKSMREMQKLQPHMAKIREKYKDDKQKMNQELMGLYKTYKVNPMGGCLPLLIQLPVFYALFRVLGSCIELRHAPFMLWITDLSAPDRLFDFPFSIPFMHAPYGIPVLTLLMGASMFIQQKMTPTVGDPAQAKMMMFLPVIFTFMFINFPSGLVLYWFVSNILTIVQQYGMKRSRT
ncbi:MAG: membrane protein insertase YidC [Deltaproteobacteria bacterium]|nr:membrane protein insertase YidC [Deltaproteobacteria bacterium]